MPVHSRERKDAFGKKKNAPDGGERYLLCETTAEVPLGCVGTAYDYRGGTFRYYGEDASGDSGLWVSD